MQSLVSKPRFPGRDTIVVCVVIVVVIAMMMVEWKDHHNDLCYKKTWVTKNESELVQRDF